MRDSQTYLLSDTTGQPAIGLSQSSSYRLEAGFWSSGATIAPLVAETSISQVEDASDFVVIKVNIDGFKDPSDNSTANITGGIGSYTAMVSSSPSGGVEILEVHGMSPFENLTFDNVTGMFSVDNVSSPIQAANTTMAEVVVILTSNTSTSVNLTICFLEIIAAGNPSLNCPEKHSNALTFLRGDTDSSGVVDIGDASWVAQYVVGMRNGYFE